MMAEERKDVLRELYKTGIIGEDWPKVTYVIVFIKDKNGEYIYAEWFNSKDHTHAEIKMLGDTVFLEMVQTGEVDITLVSNYSPCSDCAKALGEFYDQYKVFIESFTIRFSFLYLIHKQDNQNGLKNLKKAGITLEAMTAESWSEVFMWSDLVLTLAAKVRERDDLTRKTLNKVLDEVSETGEVESAEEDPGIKDLTHKTGKVVVTSKSDSE